MPCYHPIKGYICPDNKFRTFDRTGQGRSQSISCGQCVGCRLERSRQWAVRISHEASLYSRNCFITLTYNDEFLPSDNSLHYDDFQKFMKRLRFSYSGIDEVNDARPIRFYMCGEYGENFGRPHFHACLFNFDFQDKTLWKKTPSGSLIYRSKQLEELWPYGYSSVGDVTFQSAAYVARYIMKKITGSGSDSHYENGFDPETGEVLFRTPEFNKMSLKPGIGAGWYDKFSSDVYPHDFVVVNGKKCNPPRYYDKLLERSDEVLSFVRYDGEVVSFSPQLESVKDARFAAASLRELDNTPERRMVKEQVALATLDKLKRNLT